MTFKCQGHDGKDLGRAVARHLYLNFDDPRHLVLIPGYHRFLSLFFYMTLRSKGEGHGGNTLAGWAPGTCILISMIHDF